MRLAPQVGPEPPSFSQISDDGTVNDILVAWVVLGTAIHGYISAFDHWIAFTCCHGRDARGRLLARGRNDVRVPVGASHA